MDNGYTAESVLSRAYKDTESCLGFLWYYGVLLVVGLVSSIIGAVATPNNASTLKQTLIGLGSGFLGAVAAVIFTFGIALVIAPYRQRNEARATVTELRQSLQAQSDSAPSPSIQTNLKKDNNGKDFYLEVENTGGEARFEAEIRVLEGDLRLHQEKRLVSYWERGQMSSLLSKGQTDRIKIGSVITSFSGPVAALNNRLYFYDGQKSGLSHIDSEHTYLVMPGVTLQDIVKPKWRIQFRISSHPSMSQGMVPKSFEFELHRFEEIVI